MKSRTSITILATMGLAAASLAAFQPPAAKDTKAAQPPAKTDDKLEMSGQVVPQTGALTPEHKQFEKLVGNWTISTKTEMKGVPPSENPGIATLKLALGGRFVQETGGDKMDNDKTEQFKMWGYNAGTKKYEGIWSWTHSTGFLYLSGEAADSGKTIDWKAWFDDDHTGKHTEFKVKMTITDDDHFTVVIISGTRPDGSDGPTITSTYTRKK